MIQLQVISEIIQSKSTSIVENNLLTPDYFQGYEDEINFILDHKKQYDTVPDKATFLAKFPDFELVEVHESEKYLVDTIREEYLYTKAVPVVQKVADLLKSDSNSAVEYLIHAMKELQPNYSLGGIDIISQARTRYEEYLERKNNSDKWFFTSGFPELDDIIHGIQRLEEFLVIVARTNQGKSWVLEKIVTHIWQLGFNVGYISPEMRASSIGFRFDTLYKNFSNKSLMWGTDSKNDSEYEKYIDSLSNFKNSFMVATPADFDRTITITKLRNWIKQYNLNVVAIDGITYMTDERGKRGDNKTTSLTNISEDLMSLSTELGIPILVVVQANRSGANKEDTESTPDLESIRDSDGIAFNASKVLSLRQTADGILTIQVKKQRSGRVGDKLQYSWNPDIGEFIFQGESSSSPSNPSPQLRVVRKNTNKEDCF